MANIGSFKKVRQRVPGRDRHPQRPDQGRPHRPRDQPRQRQRPQPSRLRRPGRDRGRLVQALKRGPRLPLGQAGRSQLQRADLRKPLRRRGRRGLHPHLVARPQAQRRLSRTRQTPRPASGRGFLAHRYGRVRHASSFPTVRHRAQAPSLPGRTGVGRGGLQPVFRGLPPADRPHRCWRHRRSARVN